jgi:two-component system CheB/CheR fusion protein
MTQGRVAVVGIGASAGGLDAFHSFFGTMPDESGLAFVVILHLPVGRRSMLPEILRRWTNMRVLEASDGMVIEPDVVYVPPPHSVVTLADGSLGIRMPPEGALKDYRPIDAFFDSLATALREDAVGIVLSGTGNDGALGLKAIKQNGGLTIAQGGGGMAPQYDGMPAGAIATGAVDIIAAADAIPGYLMRLRSEAPAAGAPSEPDDDDATRQTICAILRSQVGHDFSGYREKTFFRRVQRRMQVLGLASLDDYVERLRQDHGEGVMLFRDLLIRVTSFFRDAGTFEVLEKLVIPRLFEGKHADGAVRAWVPGCATGEEVYSLAILLREHLDRRTGPPRVQVFGTDIDEAAISTARIGRYPTTLLDGLSEDRRARFFLASSSGYVVTREIRDLCTFSPHSIVRDPPFSRMDLVSCRNLLIYMDRDLQGAVIPAFHYALQPGGILLLGSAESISRHEELFEPLDKPSRIFVRRSVQSPPLDFRPGSNAVPTRPSLPHLPTGRRWLVPEPLAAAHPSEEANRPPAGNGAVADARVMSGARRLFQSTLGRIMPLGPQVEVLQRELFSTQQQLQSVTEEHATALEELRSSNEELHSVNEELQSTNEELETSKEELQSVNEELHTVNARLSEKIDELDHTNSDLSNLFDSTQIATIFLDRNMVIRGFTPAAAGIYYLIPSDQGRPLTDIVSRLRYDGLRRDAAQVLETLQPVERRVTRLDGAAHYLMRILPYRSSLSAVDGTVATFLDVTTIVQAEQHHRMLVDELNHRVKNMLTVVVSLAAQTLRRSSSLAEFSAAFLGRVEALTASYSLLSSQNWTDVQLVDVLTEELRPFAAPERNTISMAGPAVRLAPAGALAFGMAIHELATNAVKYGALSSADGTIHIAWRIEPNGDGEQEFVLDWTESGGPSVRQPERRGFGTTLIERGLAHELSGSAELDFATGGLRASLRAPLSTLASGHALAVAS